MLCVDGVTQWVSLTHLDTVTDGACSELLIVDRYPVPRREPDLEIEERFGIVQRFVGAVRQLRATSNIKNSTRVTVQVKPLHEDTRPMLERLQDAVGFLARIDSIEYVDERPKGAAAQYDAAFELYLDLAKYIDLAEEIARLDREIAKVVKALAQDRKKLENPSFVERAPADKVDEVRRRVVATGERLEKLRSTREELAAIG